LAELMSAQTSPLLDSYGRPHNNLRISVTDRCNIRCVYCMPEKVTFLPRAELLTFEEIERFVRIAVTLGIDKVRLTGGEPLVRRDLPRLVERLAAISGLRDVGLTTNGILLAPVAQTLYNAGLRRINVSLDTLDPAKFQELTRRPGLEQVLEGIIAAKQTGFDPVKVNAVAIRGSTENDVVPLGKFAREHGLELRFIEYMPLDAGHQWERAKVLFASDIIEILEKGIGLLVPAPNRDPRAPALDYDYADGGGRVGFIASVSRPFCLSCNRIRLTSDGKLRNCLFSLDETDIRCLLRGGADDQQIAQGVRDCVASKWEGHEINTARFIQPERLMHAIGG
jgi:cyclic pyranopterin phosphate synthase